MRTIDVQVLIVGGGGAGLTASNLMAALGVKTLLIERHPGTSHLPKAHYLNQRSMELFRQLGLDEAIYAKGAPPGNMAKITWHTSLGGDDPFDGRVIREQDAMGGGRYEAIYALNGAARGVNIPQLRLEPVLREHAERANPGDVLFRHQFCSFTESPDGIEAIVRDLDKDEDILVRARYLIAADGGKTIGPALGVSMIGPTGLADYVSIYFKADLSSFLPDDRAVMRVIMHAGQASGGQPSGGLLAQGPTRWDRHSEEWAVGWGFAPDDPARLDETGMEAKLKSFLKIETPIEIKLISHWDLEAVVADKFRCGRAFLVGDAAHKHTPFGGLGLNSGIQDVHNLCWKLSLVLSGAAPERLLESYEPERRQVVERNAENSIVAFENHQTLLAAMGLTVGAPVEKNRAALTNLFADGPSGEQRRARVAAVFNAITGSEYAPQDLEMGYCYQSDAVVDDGTPLPDRDPMGSEYRASTRPGCRLPHAWLHNGRGAISTHDLLPTGGFLLLAGPEASSWRPAAAIVAATRNVPIRIATVGRGGDFTDPSGAWGAICDIGAGGAVLVRPDGHIGYRAKTSPDDPEKELGHAIDTILGR